jgi:hypothetical protein
MYSRKECSFCWYRCEDHGFLILDFNRSACLSVSVLLCSERAMYSRTKRSKEECSKRGQSRLRKVASQCRCHAQGSVGRVSWRGWEPVRSGGGGGFQASSQRQNRSSWMKINQGIIRTPTPNTQAIPMGILTMRIGPGENQSGYHPDPTLIQP